MISNYLKIAFRTLSKNMIHSLVNILGLTLAITCAIAISLIVRDELSYDTYHSNYDNIYRLITQESTGTSGYTNGVPLPLPTALRTDFPELEKIVLLDHFRSGKITIPQEGNEPKVFIEEEALVYVEDGFFQVFDWQWLSGAPEHALTNPNSVVLAKSFAEKYFGSDEVLGNTLLLNNSTNLLVTGVVEDRPFNSDFPFDVMISFSTSEQDRNMTSWGSVASDHQCFILIPENLDSKDIEIRLGAFATKYLEEDAKKIKYRLQPLNDMHFSTVVSNMNYRSVSHMMILAISLVAVFLLLIGCINFINMETARAVKRAKEVGIRKTLGSQRSQLLGQFLGETGMIVIFAMLVALGLTELLLIELREFTGLQMEFQPFRSLVQISYLIGLVLIITIGAGFYPALVLSSYKASEVLKGSATGGQTNKFGLRQSLISFQFAISQIFIVCTLITIQQIDFIKGADMGFNKEHIVDLPLHDKSMSKQEFLRGEIAKIPGISSYTFNTRPPFSGSVLATDIDLLSTPEKDDIHTQFKIVDENYIKTYGLRLLAGEGIINSDSATRVIINQTLLKALGFDDPELALGEFIKIQRRELPILGVVEDFHTTSFNEKIAPVLLFSNPRRNRNVGIKMSSDKTPEVLASLESIWQEAFPDYEFVPEFMDETIMSHYESEQKMASLLTGFSIIAIIICSLGLYGLVSFMANQKTKEVGIRKTLGASTLMIVKLFSSEFIKLLVVGFIISAPLSWYIMNAWLQQFEYKITIGITAFLTGLITSAIIALGTVGYRSFRAAIANPVASLKEE